MLIPRWGVEYRLASNPNERRSFERPAGVVLDQLGLSKRAMRIEVFPDVPRSMGLGGSAAMAVAIVRALDKHFRLGLDRRAGEQPRVRVREGRARQPERPRQHARVLRQGARVPARRPAAGRAAEHPRADPGRDRHDGLRGAHGEDRRPRARGLAAGQEAVRANLRPDRRSNAAWDSGDSGQRPANARRAHEYLSGHAERAAGLHPRAREALRHRARERRARREAHGRRRWRVDHRDLRRRHGARRSAIRAAGFQAMPVRLGAELNGA